MLYANFVTEAVQYGIESEEKAVVLYINEMQQEGTRLRWKKLGFYFLRKSQ